MYATVRMYSGNTELAERLAERSDDIRPLMSAVAGFRAYFLVRGDQGATSVTVCDDLRGCEESNRVAADWLRENMPDVVTSPPQISAGEVLIDMMTPARV